MAGSPALDLSNREYLRIGEVYEVFGIREAYLRNLFDKNETIRSMVRRLPGERGVMLWNKEDLRKWIETQDEFKKK